MQFSLNLKQISEQFNRQYLFLQLKRRNPLPLLSKAFISLRLGISLYLEGRL